MSDMRQCPRREPHPPHDWTKAVLGGRERCRGVPPAVTAPDDLARTLAEHRLLDYPVLHCTCNHMALSGYGSVGVWEAHIAAHLASVVSRRDTDLRTRIVTLARKHAVRRASPYGVSVDTITVDELLAALDGDTREDAQ